jgi:hypothetical protein
MLRSWLGRWRSGDRVQHQDDKIFGHSAGATDVCRGRHSGEHFITLASWSLALNAEVEMTEPEKWWHCLETFGSALTLLPLSGRYAQADLNMMV